MKWSLDEKSSDTYYIIRNTTIKSIMYVSKGEISYSAVVRMIQGHNESVDDMSMSQTRAPITHKLKCYREYLQAIIDGTKTFEVRKNDRDYRVNDILELYEYNPDHGFPMGGLLEVRRILRVSDNKLEHLKDGYVILALGDIK